MALLKLGKEFSLLSRTPNWATHLPNLMDNKLIQPLYLSSLFSTHRSRQGDHLFQDVRKYMQGMTGGRRRRRDTVGERDGDDVRQKSWRVFELGTLNLHIIPQIFKPLGEHWFWNGSYSIKLKIFKKFAWTWKIDLASGAQASSLFSKGQDSVLDHQISGWAVI